MSKLADLGAQVREIASDIFSRVWVSAGPRSARTLATALHTIADELAKLSVDVDKLLKEREDLAKELAFRNGQLERLEQEVNQRETELGLIEQGGMGR